jgi:hypothetical protein
LPESGTGTGEGAAAATRAAVAEYTVGLLRTARETPSSDASKSVAASELGRAPEVIAPCTKAAAAAALVTAPVDTAKSMA